MVSKGPPLYLQFLWPSEMRFVLQTTRNIASRGTKQTWFAPNVADLLTIIGHRRGPAVPSLPFVEGFPENSTTKHKCPGFPMAT